jgi:hypothetical protein
VDIHTYPIPPTAFSFPSSVCAAHFDCHVERERSGAIASSVTERVRAVASGGGGGCESGITCSGHARVHANASGGDTISAAAAGAA